MENFLISKTNIVNDALDGAIASRGGEIGRFAVDNTARVVARRDWDKSKVAIVSGGGSGHEPAHAGFVGAGMLTAAVCGEIFASPSVDAVLSAIITVTGDAGCLLIVKNYTGDRLNFGLAAEKAKGLGYKVEMVIVADDIAIPNAAQPRGIAGTLFAHKIAGYLSEGGASLEAVHEAVSAAATKVVSIGVARDTCAVPGNKKETRIQEGQVEIGLGIHGEPGVELADFKGLEHLVANLADRLDEALPDPAARYALLINSLGGLSAIEMSILTADIMRTSLAEKVDLVIGPAPVMTALDMPGFSLSLFQLDAASIAALRAPVAPHAWPGVADKVTNSVVEAPSLPPIAQFPSSDDPVVRKVVTLISETCIAIEDEINALDAKVGDGDTGSTFAGAGKTVLAEIDSLPLADGAGLFNAMSRMTSQTVGGSSGVLFGIMFAGAAEKFETTQNWGVSLMHGLSLMKKYGGAKDGDRTMVDALQPAFAVLEAGGNLADAAAAARKGAEQTAQMTEAKAGRSSYLNARSLTGVVDPGAGAIAKIFEALAGAMTEQPDGKKSGGLLSGIFGR